MTVTLTSNSSYYKPESFPIRWANAITVHDAYNILYARILCPVSDVLCIFADDFPSFNAIVDRLKIWAVAGGGSSPLE